MESIIVAFIAALGVILSALFQWRSNVATLQAAKARDEEARNERESSQQRASEERAQIRNEEQAAKDREAQIARAEFWRTTRQTIYEKATRVVIDSQRQLNEVESFASIADGDSEADFSEFLVSMIKKHEGELEALAEGWSTIVADMQLYASDEASALFQHLYTSFLKCMNLVSMIDWHTGPAHKWIRSFETPNKEFMEAYAEFIIAAKSDLDTR